jgi:FkbM family methyltransferase
MIDIEQHWRTRPIRRINVRDIDVLFDASTAIADDRARTLLSKEPSTIKWLDSMTSSDVLYDVGANVGVYSIYSALVIGVRTYAFEPDGRNFGILCRNTDLNKLSGKLTPFCLGVSNSSGADILHARPGLGGESEHSMEAPDDTSYLQGIMKVRLDEFAKSPGIACPTMIKIDIDGLEPLVIEGLGDLVKASSLRGINIELNRTIEAHCETLRYLVEAGFLINEELGFIHRDGVSENVFLER